MLSLGATLLIIVAVGPPSCSCLFIDDLIAMPATAAAAAAAAADEAEVGAVDAGELPPPAAAAPIIDEFNNICINS